MSGASRSTRAPHSGDAGGGRGKAAAKAAATSNSTASGARWLASNAPDTQRCASLAAAPNSGRSPTEVLGRCVTSWLSTSLVS